jgi:hypothetical protein
MRDRSLKAQLYEQPALELRDKLQPQLLIDQGADISSHEVNALKLSKCCFPKFSKTNSAFNFSSSGSVVLLLYQSYPRIRIYAFRVAHAINFTAIPLSQKDFAAN